MPPISGPVTRYREQRERGQMLRQDPRLRLRLGRR